MQTNSNYYHAQPLNISKRIGSTVYDVEVYVKYDTGETIEQKLLRLIRNDLNLAPSRANMNMPQTGRLPERNLA